jgi:hypothetical protein
MRYAVVNSGVVENIISWDGSTSYRPPNGRTLVASDTASIGWGYNSSTGVFSAPLPVSQTPVVPKSITPRQCRLILLQQDLLASVEAMIAQQDEATRITWEFASEFKRDDPLLNQLGVALGLTQQQIDEFFIAAAQIP